MLFATALGVSGCSDDDELLEEGQGGTSNGGTSSNGGSAKGGTTSKGGAANGGAAVAGAAGSTAAGGVAAGGVANGGGGGDVTSGGTPSVGGAEAAGAGGVATGGAATVGGAAGSGATPSTGGAVAAGAGGAATGGAVTAGAGAAGIPSGGAATVAGAAGTTVVTVGGAAGSAGATSTVAGAGGSAGSAGESSAGTAGTGGTVVVEPVAILRYNFEDASTATVADDDTTNNNDGGLSNVTFSANTEGRNGAAAVLADAASSISVPPNLFTNVHALTVAAWVRPSATPAADTRLFEFGDGTTYLRLNMNLSGAIAVQFKGTSGGLVQFGIPAVAEATPTHFPVNVWKHVAVTVSTSGSAIYVDGKIVASLATPIDPALLTATNNLIGNSPAGTNAFQGLIDEVNVYNGVLPLAEIRTLAAPKTDYSIWHFDEGSGTTAADSSDRNMHGTIEGGATWVAGAFGTALKVDNLATDIPAVQYVDLPDGVVSNCGQYITMASWVNIETNISDGRFIEFGIGTDASTWYWVHLLTRWSGNTTIGPEFQYAYPSSGSTTPRTTRAASTAIVTNSWIHVAAVRGDNAGTNWGYVYVNGNLVGNGATGTSRDISTWTWTNANNFFGRSSVASKPGWDGTMDEILISCRAYTPDEIRHLAQRPQ